MDSNLEYTHLFEDVTEGMSRACVALEEVKSVIEGTDLIKKPTKMALLGRLDTIFTEINAICNKMGDLGEVK